MTTYKLEREIRFLSEQRTEPYIRYGEGVAQIKNGFGAKSALQGRTCFDLERYGL